MPMRWEFKTLKNYIDARQAGNYKLFLVVVFRGLIYVVIIRQLRSEATCCLRLSFARRIPFVDCVCLLFAFSHARGRRAPLAGT